MHFVATYINDHFRERRGLICHGFGGGNRIGEVMWGEVNLTCAVEFPILHRLIALLAGMN